MKPGDEEQAVRLGAARVESAGEAELGAMATGQPSEADARVVAALEKGDKPEALRVCVAEHAEALGRLCMALLGSQADAEDVLQETLLDAYRALEQWRGEGSVRSWLYGIARRKCAREHERGVRRRSKLRLVGEEPKSSREAERGLAAKRQGERARAALGALRPSEREAVVLRFGSDLSFREVAAACGIDEAAARKRVSRGLAALRSELGEE